MVTPAVSTWNLKDLEARGCSVKERYYLGDLMTSGGTLFFISGNEWGPGEILCNAFYALRYTSDEPGQHFEMYRISIKNESDPAAWVSHAIRQFDWSAAEPMALAEIEALLPDRSRKHTVSIAARLCFEIKGDPEEHQTSCILGIILEEDRTQCGVPS